MSTNAIVTAGHTRAVWTYFVSRNSVDGIPVGTCSIWWIHPLRDDTKKGKITWIPTGPLNDDGYFGSHSLEDTIKFCRVVPDDDRQLIVVEQWSRPTEQQHTQVATVRPIRRRRK